MNKDYNKEWLYAAGVRAIKTVAQTALGMFSVGAAIGEVDWKYVVSVSIVAGIYSMLTSVATTLPEIGSDGTFKINETDPTTNTILLELNSDITVLKDQKYIKLKVENISST